MALFSTYALYKRGTQTVVNWLATTATRCGYETQEKKRKKKNRNKNKNRKLKLKEAKGTDAGSGSIARGLTAPTEHVLDTTPVTNTINQTKNNKNSDSPSTATSEKQTITTKELPMMATYISEHFKEISKFEAFFGTLEVLQDVISKRKDWSTGFLGRDPSTSNSNERHKHFVVILEEVQQILVGVMKALNISQASRRDEDATASTPIPTEQQALSNIFSVLKLEDPADVEEALPTKESQPDTKIASAYELEEEFDEEEIYYRIHCFFDDFKEMRHYIRKCWADYISGILDLATVAVTTNVALEMLQRSETELLESMPDKFKLTEYSEIGGLLFNAYALGRGVDPEIRQQLGDVINMELKDIADFTVVPVYIILSSFLPVIQDQNSSIPVMKPGFYGEVDMSGKPLSWRELSTFKSPPHVLDALSLGLVEMVRTKEIPIWLVLGCQLHLDILEGILSHPSGSIERPHKELQVTGAHITQTLKSYAKFSENISIKTWPSQNDTMLQRMRDEVEECVNKDIYFAIYKKLFKSAGDSAHLIRPYSLFSRHPLLCGIMQLCLNLNMENTGSVLVNAWGALPTVLHLYNAVKHESPSHDFPVWEDLEAMIKIHGKERIFIGGFPENPEQYFKRFCLVMGYSASIFASNRREGRNTKQSQTPASSRGPRVVTTPSVITEILKPQYCDGVAQSDVTFHRIQELLFASAKKPQQVAPFLAVPFLSSLSNKIQENILAINIDYFALHMRCFDLLRDIHTTLDLDFVKFTGSPMYIEKESELPFLVGYLFGIAFDSAKAGEILDIGRRGGEVRSMTLLKASEVVKKLVVKEGRKEIERVEKCCPGYDWLS